MITPEQLNIKLDNFAACVGNDLSLLIPPLESARAEMLFRIHNEARDADGGRIGSPLAAKPPYIGVYGKQHGRKRARRGRRTDEKDLELEGDLRRSVITGTTNGVPSVGFKDTESRLIAEGQQGQTGKRIWGLSAEERQNLDNQLQAILSKDVNDCYDRS